VKYDVVIIGASSAGLFAAGLLAEHGMNVALFEKEKEIDPAPRTYIITSGLYRVLPKINEELIRHKLNTIIIQAKDQTAEIPLTSPDVVVDRRELIMYLYKWAQEAGVEIFTDSHFLGLDSNQPSPYLRIIISGEEKKFQAGFLIGADGINSQVREHILEQKLQAVPLLQAEIDLPNDWDDGVTKVWFDAENTSYFYWLIPDKNRKAVVGLISDPGQDISSKLEDFMEKYNFKPLNFQSGQASLHSQSLEVETKIGDLQVLFVGDAAGQVKITTVGGTVTGLMGGKAAAAAIYKRSSYRKELSDVMRELDLHLFIRKLLGNMANDDYQELIRYISPPVQNLLSSHDRDEMRSHFWKLPFLQPGFIPLGLKLLLKTFV